MRWIDLAPYGLNLNIVSILRDSPQENIQLSVFTGVVPEYHEGLTYCGYRQHNTKPSIWLRSGGTVDIDRIASVFDECLIIDNFNISDITKVIDKRPLKKEIAKSEGPSTAGQVKSLNGGVDQKNSIKNGQHSLDSVDATGGNLLSASPGTMFLEIYSTFGIHFDFPIELRTALSDKRVGVVPKSAKLIINFKNYSLYQNTDDDGVSRRYIRFISPNESSVVRVEGPVEHATGIEQVLYMRPESKDGLERIFRLYLSSTFTDQSEPSQISSLMAAIDTTRLAQDVNISAIYEKVLVDEVSHYIEAKGGRAGVKSTTDFKARYDLVAKFHTPSHRPMPAYMAISRLARSISTKDREIAFSVGSNIQNRFIDQVISSIDFLAPGQEDRRLGMSQLIILDFSAPEYAKKPDESVTKNGYTVNSLGELVLLEVLEKRPNESRVILMANASIGEDVWAHIACRYAIEGRASIAKSAIGGSITLASIGSSRPDVLPEAPEASMRTKIALGWSDIWDWTSDVVISRGKIKKFYESSGINEKDSVAENGFQAQYTPMSSSSDPFTMVPRNIEHAVRSAFSAFIKSHGDADAYVSKLFSDSRYEMTPQSLSKFFSAEQIDAIAMAASVKSRGVKGFLLADQTGVGKGRFCAAMAFLGTSGVLGTRKSLLLTERANNISDLVRDIRNIGVLDRINIAILNSGVTILNSQTQEVTNLDLPKDVWDKCFNEGVWPEGVDIIIGTYSNFNRSNVVERRVGRGRRQRIIEDRVINQYTKKARWVKAVTGSDVLLVRDESQNGSAHSQVGKTISKLIDQAGHVVSSSGSYVRDPKSINQYTELFPASMSGQNMASILAHGGETAQEALAFAMAESGVMLRREHRVGLSTIVPVSPTPDEIEYNKSAKDALAVLISELSYMTGAIGERVNEANREIIEHYIESDPILRRDIESDKSEKALQAIPSIKMVSIGGALYSIARAFTAMLAAQTKVSEIAIERLKAGEKPVVLFETTNEQLLRDINEAYGEDGDDEIALPQFVDVLRKVIKRSLTIRMPSENNVERRNNNNVGRVTSLNIINRNGRRYYLAAENDETAIYEYITAMTRRSVLSHPNIAETIKAEDKSTLKAIILDAVESHAKNAARYGYASPEFIAIKMEEAKENTLKAIDEFDCKSLIADPHYLPIMPDNLAGYLVRIEDIMGSIPEMSSSAIDTVMGNIRKAGYSVGEITGRKLRIEDGKIVPRTDTNRLETISKFNGYMGFENNLDALVINMTGAVGSDMHATADTPDQRPRCMVVAEMPQDVVVLLQAYGRISRFGNIHPSKIYIPNLGLVCHEHLIAMINAKVRRWSAGIAGNRNSSNAIDGVHNMINMVGDHVANMFLRENPDIAIKLGLSVGLSEGETAANTNWSVRADILQATDKEREEAELAAKNKNPETVRGEADDAKISRVVENLRTGGMDFAQPEEEDTRKNRKIKMSKVIQRLIMLPSDEESQILTRLQREYDATIAEMDARGENPLRAQEINGKVHIQSMVPMSGMSIESESGVFERQTVIQNVLIEQPASPIRSAQVELYVSKSNHLGDQYLHAIDKMELYEAAIYMTPGRSIDDEIANGNTRVINIRNNANNVRWALKNLSPGSMVETMIDSERVWGISLGVFRGGWGTVSVTGYDVKLVIPGSADILTINLKTLLADNELKSDVGLNGPERDQILNHFDTQSESSRIRRRSIISGNAWNATCLSQGLKFGHMVSWAGHGGVVNRGVLLNPWVKPLDIPTEIATKSAYKHIVKILSPTSRLRSNIKYYQRLKSDEKRVDNSHITISKSKGNGRFLMSIRPSTQNFEVDIFSREAAVMSILINTTFEDGHGLINFINRIKIDDLVKKVGKKAFMDAVINSAETLYAGLEEKDKNFNNRKLKMIVDSENHENPEDAFFDAINYLRHVGTVSHIQLVVKKLDLGVSIDKNIPFQNLFNDLIDSGVRFFGPSSMRSSIMKAEARDLGDKEAIDRLNAYEKENYVPIADGSNHKDGDQDEYRSTRDEINAIRERVEARGHRRNGRAQDPAIRPHVEGPTPQAPGADGQNVRAEPQRATPAQQNRRAENHVPLRIDQFIGGDDDTNLDLGRAAA